MTRTNKWTVHESRPDPRYFSHNGNFGENPYNVKKQGFGKGNWGRAGDEIEDLIDDGEIPEVFNKSRRGSNVQFNERKYGSVQHSGDA